MSPVQLSTCQHSPGKPNAAQYSSVQQSTAQYSPVQPSTAQHEHSPVQPSRSQYSPVQPCAATLLRGPQICPVLKICAKVKQGKSCLGHVVTEVCFLKWQEMERRKEKQLGNSFKMRTSAGNFRVVIVIMGVLHAIKKTSTN